ncbi:hypothetical protein K3495_g1749 [Podosphaera aphanis]|nr:hypothetical protein K3495_g1749 [Podosphaera aphanis]
MGSLETIKQVSFSSSRLEITKSISESLKERAQISQPNIRDESKVT